MSPAPLSMRALPPTCVRFSEVALRLSFHHSVRRLALSVLLIVSAMTLWNAVLNAWPNIRPPSIPLPSPACVRLRPSRLLVTCGLTLPSTPSSSPTRPPLRTVCSVSTYLVVRTSPPRSRKPGSPSAPPP
ncbi:Uncharacterised protein [Bordetella pertussis]|nr:Uncharacterised protein [Bordetella pertussis]CFN67608.1 Uncharacterised protein [Bordetella pertussis]CFO03253.1 Uncharacterised protein [Bordetella pertussis]CFP14738.1 Uncharacterised protein [Bordetella pertussis]CFP17755.1 Uncharacterised protein [Bordetella pertussis]